MNTLHVKKDDIVVVISGKTHAKDPETKKWIKRKVIAVSPKEGKVIVEGANMVKKNVKARRQGEVSSQVETEAAIYASKVQLFCEKCDAPRRSKVGYETVDGKQVKVRLCAKCGAKI